MQSEMMLKAPAKNEGLLDGSASPWTGGLRRGTMNQNQAAAGWRNGMPVDMKVVIATAFGQMARKKPIDKITVKDLVEQCGISRQAFYYNDQQPDRIFYQGLAWRALGNESKARGRFNQLIDHGRKHLFDHCRIDYFAVSLPELAIWEDDLEVRNRIHCYYVMALGYSGLGQNELAEEYYAKVKALDVNKQMFKISLG